MVCFDAWSIASVATEQGDGVLFEACASGGDRSRGNRLVAADAEQR